MSTMIFVNLPVRDLPRAMTFFEALGFRFNPLFTDDTGACLVIEEGSIHAMLLTHEKFGSFTPKATSICDATRSTEVLIALSRESRGAVDDLVRKAVAAGGTIFRDPEDHGFMYGHAFQDLDGHVWELFWMDPKAVPGS
jgi:predicted lactoylglutathione lyase